MIYVAAQDSSDKVAKVIYQSINYFPFVRFEKSMSYLYLCRLFGESVCMGFPEEINKMLKTEFS